MLWNLIKNAVKFTPEGGEIVIESMNGSAGSDDAGAAGRLIVRVIDNGIGIDAEALPRIFEAFEQGAEAVARKLGGMGLGLSICKLLVERHEGTLSAKSEGTNRGATFTLSLPTCDPPPAAAAGPRGSYATRLGKRRLRILLVEDHHDTNYALTRLLQSAGHDVTAAHDCAEATARAAERGFDLLICDLRLPDGSGLDVMSNLRASGVRGIALTGYGSDADIERSMAAGFERHLTKPITLDQLVQAMLKMFPS